jgi:BatD DUF11 like domain
LFFLTYARWLYIVFLTPIDFLWLMIIHIQKVFIRFFVVLVIFGTSSIFNQSEGQATFSVVCPQKTIGKNDYLQIQFKVDHASNVESINPPDFKNFSVVSGPNQESGMTSINGKVDQYVSLGYVLKPSGPGNYTIGTATAKADGKDFQTTPIKIQVTNNTTPSSSSASSSMAANSNNPASLFPAFPGFNFDLSPLPASRQFDDYILRKGENVAEKVKKNLFLKLDVSRTSCYVGEPIVVSFKLYTRLQSQSTITDAPSFDGFSVNDLQVNNSNSSTIEKYNGRNFNVYTLRKVELYPLRPGTFTLEPIKADNDVEFVKASYANSMQNDMFDMMQNFLDVTTPKDALVEQHVSTQSQPVEITVKPLPLENKPVDFKGAVGNFTLQSSLQKNDITTDDGGNLKLVVSGTGNIQLINAPKINWPAGIDGYDAKITDGIDKNAVPMTGTKTFTYPFTVEKPGNFTIPSISFSFFDPSTKSYKTVYTDSLLLIVSRGKRIPNATFASVQKANSGIHNLFGSYGLYAIGVMIITGALIFWFRQRKYKVKEEALLKATKEATIQNNGSEKKSEEFKVPGNPLKEANEQLTEGNSPKFYRTLDHSMRIYLASKFNVPAEELDKNRINEELDRHNVGLGTSLRLNALLEEIELNVYAPPSPITHLKETYEKAAEVVSLLDKQVTG